MKDLFKDKKWLENQYKFKNKSEYLIADECGVSRSTIFHWRKKHGIPSNRKRK